MNLKTKANLIKNINELARIAQKKAALLAVGTISALLFAAWVFSTPSSPKAVPQETTKMASAIDPQFTESSSQKALEEQQDQIKTLTEQLEATSKKLDDLQKSLDEDQHPEIAATQELQLRLEELENNLKKSGSQLNPNPAGSNQETPREITTTSFSYTDISKNISQGTEKTKTIKNYVPPGSFAKAVLLSGADTNAGVHGQGDTTPITMRILDNGTLPNGEHSSLKGCFVTAAAYGDASSERGQIRLQRLSCIRKPSKYVLDIPIEGTINDMGGSDGIRGHVVMRNNNLIWNAGISGVLSGVGSAVQQSYATQAVSPLGATSLIQPNKVFQSGAFGGANTALGKLADYYIKLADMYHPIIQVHAGSQVNIVFLKGFSLTEGEPQAVSIEPNKSTNTQEVVPQNLSLKDTRIGQSLDVNENINTGELQ